MIEPTMWLGADMESPSPEQEPEKRSEESDSPDEERPDQPRRQDDGPQPRAMPPGLWLLLLAALVFLLIWSFVQPLSSGSKVKFSFLLEQLREDNVVLVKGTGDKIEGDWRKAPTDPDDKEKTLKDEFHTVVPMWARDNDEFQKLLKDNNVDQDAEELSSGGGGSMLLWFIAPLLLVFFLFLMLRRGSDPMGSGFLGSFSRSPAKKFQATDQATSFKDVAAMDSAKSELMEVVEFLKAPAKFEKLGAQIPKGVLLVGAPGTGKTLLARATAGEAGVPFYSINGSEFIQMFVGVGASRVRDLFNTAKENSPCIVFIDEIDAVGRHRGAGVGGGHDEREQTLNQILSEMDGFEQSNSVIVVAATNRPDVLDPALLRPGRFDRHVTIDRPTKLGRAAILKVHTRKVPLGEDIDLTELAKSTTGFSGAELKNLVNEAALTAVRFDKKSVNMEDFEAAYDRVLMGPKREEVLNLKERRMTAYHEAGHALLGWFQAEVDEVHKVSIIPRGRTLGVTQFQPDEERFHVGEHRLHAQLAMILAGRAAEKVIFDEYSAGAEDDLKKATRLARGMVAHWGMSEKIGPVACRQGEDHPFLGKEMHEARQFSEETAHVIDQEIAAILRAAQQTATDMLVAQRDDLERMSDELLDKETLNREDLVKLWGEPVALPSGDEEENSASEPTGESTEFEPSPVSDVASDSDAVASAVEDAPNKSEDSDESTIDQVDAGTTKG
jgi:cell division protease FtsH